jgi:hypothetical protein
MKCSSLLWAIFRGNIHHDLRKAIDYRSETDILPEVKKSKNFQYYMLLVWFTETESIW